MSDSLAAAIVSAQAELPAVPPNAINPHFKSKFATLDHILAKVLPVLNKHGIAVTQWPTASPEGAPMLATRLVHVSGEQMESVMPLLVGKNDMQGLGGAITYARRYMLAAALGISAEEDDDGTMAAASPPAVPAKRTPTANGSPGVITPEQVTRLHTIASKHKVPRDEAKRIVKEWGGVDSSKDLRRDRYEAVCAAIKEWQPPAEHSFADQIPLDARADA